MKLCIRVTYDVDINLIQYIRDYAWISKISCEEAVLDLYNKGKIDMIYSDKRTAEILSFDAEDFYNCHLCSAASISTKFCNSCPVTNCPHLGHSDKEHFEGVAHSVNSGDFYSRMSKPANFSDNNEFGYEDDDEYDDEDDEYEDDDYDDSQYRVQQRQMQRQQDEYQKQQVEIQKQQLAAQQEQIKAQKAATRAMLETQIAQLKVQRDKLFQIRTSPTASASEKSQALLQSHHLDTEINALESKLWRL